MPLKTYSGSEAERAAASASGSDVVASPKRCPVCGGAMPGRKTSACSDRCRARKSRLARVPLPRDGGAGDQGEPDDDPRHGMADSGDLGAVRRLRRTRP